MTKPTLVYLYGPPAVGKLTVATELHRITGFRLFDNHLTVDAVKPVFAFGTDPFADIIHRLRLDVFETAAASGVDVIFTNNSVWGRPNGREEFRAFAEETRRRVDAKGGRVVFVQLTAPSDVLCERVGAESRHRRGKLVGTERLLELLALLDPAPLHDDDLVIDTSVVQPSDAAAEIARHVGATDS